MDKCQEHAENTYYEHAFAAAFCTSTFLLDHVNHIRVVIVEVAPGGLHRPRAVAKMTDHQLVRLANVPGGLVCGRIEEAEVSEYAIS